MSQYPMTAATSPKMMSSAKRHRMNQIYGTVAPAKPIRKQPPTKGPNVFKKMIRGLVTWSMKDDIHAQEDIVISDREEHRLSGTGIRFEVYRANGGTVVETRRPDRRSGDTVYELHVITDTQDIGQAIGQIITLESLKS